MLVLQGTKWIITIRWQKTRRHDLNSLESWKAGKALLWDVTIVNSLASSYLSASSSSVGSIAEMAAEEKKASIPT